MDKEASEAAKELIDETDRLELSDIEGTGTDGKVIKTDVERVIEKGYVERRWGGQTKYVELGGSYSTLSEEKIKERVQ